MLIFKRLVTSQNFAIEFIESTFIKAQKHGYEVACSEPQDVGKSQGSNITKIHMAVDAAGKSTEFYLSSWNSNESTIATKSLVNSKILILWLAIKVTIVTLYIL